MRRRGEGEAELALYPWDSSGDTGTRSPLKFSACFLFAWGFLFGSLVTEVP